MSKALITAPQAWEAPRSKLKRPGEWIIAALRAIGAMPADIGADDAGAQPARRAAVAPIGAQGFADDSAPWLDGLAQRLDIANQIARRVGAQLDPRQVFQEVLAPLASTETRQAVMRAESRPQALALLLMAPEFQRR